MIKYMDHLFQENENGEWELYSSSLNEHDTIEGGTEARIWYELRKEGRHYTLLFKPEIIEENK